MPLLSSLLHHLASYIWPGPPPSMQSPLPHILRDDQFVEIVAKAITDDVWTTSPDIYRHYLLRRIAVTKSNLVGKIVYHQSLVLAFDDATPSSAAPSFHILVAERCTRPDDVPTGSDAVGASRPNRSISQRSLDAASKKLPHGEGRDTIRYWDEKSRLDDGFWRGTTGNRDSDFKAENGVVFDFGQSNTTIPLTLYEVILSMRAVSLVAPKYQFTRENCWWWAQSVLLLLLRLRQKNQILGTEESETFFRRMNDPTITLEFPQYHGITSFVNRSLVLDNAEKALENYYTLADQAKASLDNHRARARLPAERDEALQQRDEARQQLDAEMARANAEAERAEWNAREASRAFLEASQASAEVAQANAEAAQAKQETAALRALLIKRGINPLDSVPSNSSVASCAQYTSA